MNIALRNRAARRSSVGLRMHRSRVAGPDASEQRARGFTLVELLIVIGVLSVLAGIALPIFRETIKEQKTTQAARQVVTYIEAARSRAIASKGRVGVLIHRHGVGDPLQRSYSTQMQLSVAYPPYTGESDNARALLYHHDSATDQPSQNGGIANAALFDPAENTLLYKATMDWAASRPGGAFQPWDRIQFGNSGRRVLIAPGGLSILNGATGKFAGYNGWVKVSFDPRGAIPTPGMGTDAVVFDFPSSLFNIGTSGMRFSKYKIFRDPVPSAASPLDMLRGMAIDLNYSGIGADGVQFSPLVINASAASATTPVDFYSVLLMFGPDGRIEFCSSGMASANGSGVNWVDYHPTNLIYFCLGRTDGVFAEPTNMFSDEPRERANIMDPESIWIVVNPFNGSVTAAPAADPSLISAAAAGPSDDPAVVASQLSLAVQESRQFAFQGDELTSL